MEDFALDFDELAIHRIDFGDEDRLHALSPVADPRGLQLVHDDVAALKHAQARARERARRIFFRHPVVVHRKFRAVQHERVHRGGPDVPVLDAWPRRRGLGLVRQLDDLHRFLKRVQLLPSLHVADLI